MKKKIVHKDIKPSNIFIGNDDNIKLGDFSSSGIMPISSEIATYLRMTNRTKQFGYTPIFKSPENKASFKSDIWSLGVTLYYLAEQKYPFEGEDPKEIKKIY